MDWLFFCGFECLGLTVLIAYADMNAIANRNVKRNFIFKSFWLLVLISLRRESLSHIAYIVVLLPCTVLKIRGNSIGHNLWQRQ